jgi:translation initiation factor IF-2
MECGIGLNGFADLKEGDLIEAFSTEKLAADLGALTSSTPAVTPTTPTTPKV